MLLQANKGSATPLSQLRRWHVGLLGVREVVNLRVVRAWKIWRQLIRRETAASLFHLRDCSPDNWSNGKARVRCEVERDVQLSPRANQVIFTRLFARARFVQSLE